MNFFTLDAPPFAEKRDIHLFLRRQPYALYTAKADANVSDTNLFYPTAGHLSTSEWEKSPVCAALPSRMEPCYNATRLLLGFWG